MLVLKFGGTSVGSAERIKEVANLIDDNKQKIVVLSAMSGTTNALVEIINFLYENNHIKANELITNLEDKYNIVVDELFNTKKYKEKGYDLVKNHFEQLRLFTRDVFTQHEEKELLANGELISTALMQFHLEEKGIKSNLISALNFMRINKSEEPDYEYITKNLKKELDSLGNYNIIITQGFICRNAYGSIDNLKRGGSDYSASIIGAVSNASEIQIWTDIDGVHTNDPRIVEDTHAIAELSFDEAAELAYFGAKILHPTCVMPAKMKNIPVRIKNTLDPKADGTLITDNTTKVDIKAIAAKDGITAIKIKSGRMLMAYGFLRKVFEIFETYQTSIDMITTSEVGVSVTIDDDKNLDKIIADLKKYGTVDIDNNQVIVCIVGNLIAENNGIAASVFNAIKDIPVRMISYGGSNHNISILVKAEYKKQTLVTLNEKLFNK